MNASHSTQLTATVNVSSDLNPLINSINLSPLPSRSSLFAPISSRLPSDDTLNSIYDVSHTVRDHDKSQSPTGEDDTKRHCNVASGPCHLNSPSLPF
jgi:hypothetical protein